MRYESQVEQNIIQDILEFRDNQLGFVAYAYPWGKDGTPLANKSGPSNWQKSRFLEITDNLLNNNNLILQKKETDIYRSATASGHGIGKSAMMAWAVHWFMSTHIGSTTVVTANTESQLRGKTWPELGRWITLAINGHWFELTATKLSPSRWFGDMVKKELMIDTKYYYAEAVTWNEEKPEAFAGIHSHIGTMFIFDEAATIPACIWETTMGAMTDGDGVKIWLVFGNPTQNSGSFFECFHKFRSIWNPLNIDSRDVSITNKKYLNEIISLHGEDHDIVRVRIRGIFPKQGDNQFISSEVVNDAVSRETEFDSGAPLIMGVDVARFGDDSSIIAFRQGRDAKNIQWQSYCGISTMELTYFIVEACSKYKPDAIFIDGGGVGGGVVDRLKELGFKVIEVQFGSKSSDKNKYYNKRCEIWNNMKDWLSRGSIPNDQELISDLIAPLYKYTGDASTLYIERKAEMKKRGLPSPDKGDALALTFSQKVARSDIRASRRFRSNNRMAQNIDYNVFG